VDGGGRRNLGAELTIAKVRSHWTYWVLVVLRNGQMQPRDLRPLVETAAGGYRDTFGERRLHDKILFAVLRRAEDEGLVHHQYDHTRSPRASWYWLTDFSKELVDALDPLSGFEAAHRAHLFAVTAARHGMTVDEAGFVLDPDDPWVDADLRKYSGIALALQMVYPQWSFPMLAELRASGTMAPTRLLEAVNEAVDRRRPDGGPRVLRPKVCWETLDRLEADGLIERERLPGVPPKADCTLTPVAEHLLAALDPVGEWAEQHLAGLLPRQAGRRE